VAEIKHLQKTYDTKEIVFWDDIFTLNKYWISKFCDTLISEGIDIAWSCESRLDLITEEMVNKMAKAGCWNMFFGIESGNQDILNNIKKRTNLDLIRRGVKYVKASGIEVRGSFMLGLPGETPEKARNTIKFAIELDPDYAQFSITTPYPGTELYKTIDLWGILNENFDNFHNWSPVFIPKGYKNSEELQAMQREAFRRFYLRPKYIARRLSKIRSLDDVKRNLKGARMIFGFAT
ncbi:MAG: radical SAM protein, partial [DPANN group archaeon]|nr:radical SAM protein [DPANN group archaeon]